THTKENEKNPWWELDLGSDRLVEAIVIWNRTDGDLGKRLDGFKLTVFDEHRKAVFVKEKNPAPERSVRFTLEGNLAEAVKLAALQAVTSSPGQEAEVFATLTGFVQKGEHRDASIRALRRLPRSKWPAAQARPLLDSLVNYVSKLPAEQRAEPAALDALQLANDLTTLLPVKDAKEIRAKLGAISVNVVLVRTVPHKIAFDRTKFYVEAGKPVVVVLENSDIQPHNLIITAPGALTEVGMAAELMATSPDGFAKHFVPNSPKVLHATQMLQPREVQRLTFIAP